MASVDLADDLPYAAAMDGDEAIERRFMDLMQRETQNAWAALLQTEAGRLIAWSILADCHVFSSTYTGNAAQAFLEGERNVGLKILNGQILPNGPHLLAEMMTEADHRFERLMAVAQGQTQGDTDG